VEETEIFKICLEYWNALASELYRDSPCAVSAPLFVNKQVTLELPPRRLLYVPVLSKVRQVMISRMAKPEEVLVVETDQGEVVREFMKDTDSINLYKNMRETLGTPRHAAVSTLLTVSCSFLCSFIEKEFFKV